MGDRTNGRQLESAGRTLAGALARLSVGDFQDAAALLRCTAKYLEGMADAGTGSSVRPHVVGGTAHVVG
jgi:hypothetical protein